MNKKIIGSAIVGAATIGALTLGVMSTTIIEQGHTGVVFSLGDGVQDTTLDQGLRFIAPWHRVTSFPTSLENARVETFNVITRDGKPLELDMTYNFSVRADAVSDVFVKFRGQSIETIVDTWLQDMAQQSALRVFARYSVMDVFQNLPRIQADIFEEMRDTVADYGFFIQNVIVQAPSMDQNTADAVQEVVNAQQILERMNIELQQAEVEAETLRIQAEAEKTANKLLEQSLTPELIQYKMLDRWNGELPLVTSDSGFMMDFSSLLGE